LSGWQINKPPAEKGAAASSQSTKKKTAAASSQSAKSTSATPIKVRVLPHLYSSCRCSLYSLACQKSQSESKAPASKAKPSPSAASQSKGSKVDTAKKTAATSLQATSVRVGKENAVVISDDGPSSSSSPPQVASTSAKHPRQDAVDEAAGPAKVAKSLGGRKRPALSSSSSSPDDVPVVNAKRQALNAIAGGRQAVARPTNGKRSAVGDVAPPSKRARKPAGM